MEPTWPLETRWLSCQYDKSSQPWIQIAILVPLTTAFPTTCFLFPPDSLAEKAWYGCLAEGSLKGWVLRLQVPSEPGMGRRRREKVKLLSCPVADAQTVRMCWAWAGWLAGLRDSLVPLVLPLSALSMFQEVAGNLRSLCLIQPSSLVFISGRKSPCPSFEAAASSTCLFSPSRRHFCSECCLLLAPSASAWSSCWVGSKYTSGVMGVWNS